MVVAALVSVALLLQPPAGLEAPESCPEGATMCAGGCMPGGEPCPPPRVPRPDVTVSPPTPTDEEMAAKIQAAWGCDESDAQLARRKLKWLAAFGLPGLALAAGGVAAAVTMREPVSPREDAELRLTRQGLGVSVSLLLISSALLFTASIGAMRLKRKRVQCDPGGCALRF
ncbi:hypothetical protein OV090_02675 [Nannocystis sp. RBIL2]|uniref:hypothetical protein n=1 Tax=Nannocystis sp. RBIL2 TaxID=2996788 RepID=UPI00226E3E9C|nr:hypothetical protein [Nannocystis sp. RBIL2]MCY1063647.1 hypothetical protein [Nannocystis sp. RBIL2]